MTIVITRPDFFTAEAERITELLLSGQASLVHIRKPESTASETEALIRALPASLYDRLTLHDHLHLAVRYGLHGIHLNRRNPQRLRLGGDVSAVERPGQFADLRLEGCFLRRRTGGSPPARHHRPTGNGLGRCDIRQNK